MLKAQSKNLLFFNDLVHHSRFVFFCIFIHGNDAAFTVRAPSVSSMTSFTFTS